MDTSPIVCVTPGCNFNLSFSITVSISKPDGVISNLITLGSISSTFMSNYSKNDSDSDSVFDIDNGPSFVNPSAQKRCLFAGQKIYIRAFGSFTGSGISGEPTIVVPTNTFQMDLIK